MFGKKKSKRIYLDWAAATPMRPEVVKAMQPYFEKDFGNPSAIHEEGLSTRKAIENARQQVAKTVQVRPELVTFTGGGTEGNNLAIIGSIKALLIEGQDYSDLEIVTTKIEHPSVIKSIEYLATLGVQVRYVEVDKVGRIDLSSLEGLLNKKTVLVSVSYVNSEIGVIQPLRQIKKILALAEKRFSSQIYLHVDGAQAPLWLTCQADSVGADMLVLDTAKCCGPKGVGVLIRSRRTKLSPVMHGGGQEDGLRSGTEIVAGIVGAGLALELATRDFKARSEKVTSLRDEVFALIETELPQAILNGPVGNSRVANNINISIPGLDTEYTTVVLNQAGFAVSTKSACSGVGGGVSTVIQAVSGDTLRSGSTLRITLGPDTKIADIKKLTQVLKKHIEKMSALTN
jgi:cysteine desulfurase